MKEPVWLLPEALLAAHDAQIAEHGGLDGVRDIPLFESAIAHPRNLFHYGVPTIFELAAAYTSRIAGNHPFVDGNKRVTYVAMRLFLLLNGFDLTASPAERVDIMMRLAAGEFSECHLAEWIKSNTRAV
jgi:death on curing protein